MRGEQYISMNWNFLVLVLNHRIVGILATAIGVIAMVYFNFWILFISIFIIEWQILIACLEPKQDLIKKYSSLMWFLGELSCIDKNITLIIQEHENVAKKFNNLNEKINNINNNIYNLLEQNTSLTLIQKEFLELFKETNILNKYLKEKIDCENVLSYRIDWDNIECKYNKFISKLEDPDFIKIKNTVKDELLVSLLLLKNKKNKWDLIDNHNSDLIKTIQAWQGFLPPKISLTKELCPNRFKMFGCKGFDISFIEKIEALPLFADEDIFHHCPPNLKLVWTTFKDMSITHSENKQALYNSIKNMISQKLKTLNISINTDSDGFYISIYNECIFKADNKDSGYDYFPNEPIIHATNQVIYCKVFEGKEHQADDATCHLLALLNNEDERKLIKAIHRELIKETSAQYIEQSKKIIDLEAKFREAEDVLNEELKTAWLTRMDCDVIKKRVVSEEPLPSLSLPTARSYY